MAVTGDRFEIPDGSVHEGWKATIGNGRAPDRAVAAALSGVESPRGGSRIVAQNFRIER
jgi:hypothetical protein